MGWGLHGCGLRIDPSSSNIAFVLFPHVATHGLALSGDKIKPARLLLGEASERMFEDGDTVCNNASEHEKIY
jgi:hypothetical protein